MKHAGRAETRAALPRMGVDEQAFTGGDLDSAWCSLRSITSKLARTCILQWRWRVPVHDIRELADPSMPRGFTIPVGASLLAIAVIFATAAAVLPGRNE